MVQARRRAFNHDKSPHFFKVFFPDQSSERLRVPPPFIKHFNGVIPERVILRSRIGRFWSVEMAQDEDNWFFQDGWKEFVQDNSLRSGYFLVFRYNYNSSFDVLIFDSTSCEKEEFSTCTNGGRRKAEEAKEDLNKNTSSLKRVYFVRNPQEVRRKKCGCTQSKRAVAVEAEEERVPKAEKLVKPKEKIVTKANKLDKPKNPQFTACFSMLMAHLLYIPKKVVTENMFKVHPNMILCDPRGRSWPVKVFTWRDGRIVIGSGWYDFWKANNLKSQDECTFEFCGKGKNDNVIQVHIQRSRVMASTSFRH